MINDLTSRKDEILNLWNSGDFENHSELSRHIVNMWGNFGRKDDNVRRTVSKWIHANDADKELIKSNVRYKKEKQKAQDLNRIQNKAFREHARIENALTEYTKALLEQLKLNAQDLKSKIKITDCGIVDGGIGIIHLTDTHGNEIIDLPHNQYNFEVLGKRLKKQISESLAYFKFRGVKKVLMGFTGDLLNSDRRLDEMLNQATNRAKATALMSHIILQAIMHVRQFYEVEIVSVLGNESRAKQEMSFSNEVISDNYDFTILSMCEQTIKFAKIDGIRFLSIDKMEAVVDFGEQKWLFAHDVSKITDKQDKTQSTIGRYMLNGENINFIIGGHIHAFRGTDISCRGGSLAGSNTYNEHALNLKGHASAVCYVVSGKERFYQYIDCQEANNEGYEIISKLEAYNVKSSSKLVDRQTIFSVVI